MRVFLEGRSLQKRKIVFIVLSGTQTVVLEAQKCVSVTFFSTLSLVMHSKIFLFMPSQQNKPVSLSLTVCLCVCVRSCSVYYVC